MLLHIAFIFCVTVHPKPSGILETVWLTQQLMAELFQTTKQNIGLHLKNIFGEGELAQESVVRIADNAHQPDDFEKSIKALPKSRLRAKRKRDEK